MGYLMGTTVTNIFLRIYGIVLLERYLPEFKPVVYYNRHIDDVFLLFGNINHIENLNLQHISILKHNFYL